MRLLPQAKLSFESAICLSLWLGLDFRESFRQKKPFRTALKSELKTLRLFFIESCFW